jgi:NADH dehydrogenase
VKTEIVVVGGGAGGLELVRRLGAKLGRRQAVITLLEPQQTHIWKPLLHEVAAGSLDANLDELGYREHAHRWHYRFFQGRLEDIDRERREVVVAPILDEDGSELIGRQRIRYDYLIIAIGSVTNSHGTPGADRFEWDRFAKALADSAYGGPICIESFTAHNASIARAASIWRPLADTQDALAVDGLAFLRSVFQGDSGGES